MSIIFFWKQDMLVRISVFVANDDCIAELQHVPFLIAIGFKLTLQFAWGTHNLVTAMAHITIHALVRAVVGEGVCGGMKPGTFN